MSVRFGRWEAAQDPDGSLRLTEWRIAGPLAWHEKPLQVIIIPAEAYAEIRLKFKSAKPQAPVAG